MAPHLHAVCYSLHILFNNPIEMSEDVTSAKYEQFHPSVD
jgi:hypothetical protein